MSLLSKSCVYGMRATIYVALHEQQGGYVPIRHIARELKISFHFLTKILQKLTEDGILHSYRGPAGGVALARPATRISLMDLVQSIDGSGLFTQCVLGLEHCGEDKPCPMHKVWARHRATIQRQLLATSVAKMAREAGEGKIRLGDG